MVSSGVVAKVACMLALVTEPYAEAAITCGTVVGLVNPCIEYLRTGRFLPPACCNGVRNLNNAARTMPDRQAVCQCLKAAISGIPGISGPQFGRAASLPGRCGVNIPYRISPSTDCTRVR